MTEEALQKLKAAFALSSSDEEACAYAGISPSVLYNYQKRNPQFKEEKAALKMRPNLKSRQTIVSNLDNLTAAQWWAERKMKKEFSTRQEVTGEDGKDLIPEPTKEQKQEAANHWWVQINGKTLDEWKKNNSTPQPDQILSILP